MAVSLKHAFTSGKPDGADNTLVQPSNWNAEHALTLGSSKLLGRITSGIGAVEEISVGSGLTMASGSIAANVTSVAGRTGAVTLAVADVAGATALVAMGAAAAGSGTSKDFSAIPATAKRVTLILHGVSLSGTALLRVQLGTSAGLATSGYVSTGSIIAADVATAAATAGFEVYADAPDAAYSVSGTIVFHLVGSNTWVASGTVGWGGVASTGLLGGYVALGAALTQLRLTTTNGTDTFDAGNVNVFYE